MAEFELRIDGVWRAERWLGAFVVARYTQRRDGTLTHTTREVLQWGTPRIDRQWPKMTDAHAAASRQNKRERR